MSVDAMAFAFPAVDSGAAPLGAKILVQIRTPKTRTAGGILLNTESQEVEKWNTQVGKVIAIGPLAFRDRKTMDYWPEGQWVQVGDFVRVPKYGADRWAVDLPDRKGDEALFIIINDLEIIGKITGDPLTMKAYV